MFLIIETKAKLSKNICIGLGIAVVDVTMSKNAGIAYEPVLTFMV